MNLGFRVLLTNLTEKFVKESTSQTQNDKTLLGSQMEAEKNVEETIGRKQRLIAEFVEFFNHILGSQIRLG